MLATSSVLRAGLIGFALFLSSVADGADQPISGAKLILTRTASGREKLVFISRDPAFLFPAPGSADDPSHARTTRTAAASRATAGCARPERWDPAVEADQARPAVGPLVEASASGFQWSTPNSSVSSTLTASGPR